MTTTILLASSNPHKLQEVRAIIAGLQSQTHDRHKLAFVGFKDIGLSVPEPDETENTFEGNAALKARYYAAQAGMLCIADDSGLEVDALGGEPGVKSARYSGVAGGRDEVDPANNRKLLECLGQTEPEKRAARFVCALALAGPADKPLAWYTEQGLLLAYDPNTSRDKTLISCRGTVEGRILLPSETSDPSQPHLGRGANGFGYDPLFFISRMGKTTAELSSDEKNQISHRGDAVRKFWTQLKPMLG